MFSRLSRIVDLLTQPRHNRPIEKTRMSVRPAVELLEDRCVPANHAPIGTAAMLTIAQSQPYAFQTSDFGFTDPNDSPSNNLLAVEFTTIPSGGIMDNNLPVARGAFVPAADISARLVQFTPLPGGQPASFTFQVQDDGGTANGGVDTDPTPRTMTLQSNYVNQAPSFSASNPPAVDECADPVSIPNWASFNAGSSSESWQTATYIVSNVSNPGLFSVAPAVDASGTLTYTVAPYVNGTSTFDLRVKDNGGTANGGQDTSGLTTFTAAVAPVVNLRPVNTTNDTEATAENLANGTPRDAAGDTSLRAAIQVGNRAPVGTTVRISFAPGMANSTFNLGIELPALDNNFRISALGVDGITVQRLAGARSFRIFTVDAGTEVTIRDLTIAGGNAAGIGDLGNGGGIYNAGNLELFGVVLHDDSAGRYWGAVANAAGASLLVYDCSLYYNSAFFGGGGIMNYGTAFLQGGSSVFVNTAARGAGIYNDNGASLSVTDGSQIYSNTASFEGGGIENFGNLTMENAVLNTNLANYWGGGLCNEAGTAALTNVSMERNNAYGVNIGMGGGVYVTAGTVWSAPQKMVQMLC